MMSSAQQNLKRVRGFSLLEVLVALLLISVGFVGLASIMMHMVDRSYEPLTRQSSFLAARDLLERMAENPQGAQSGAYRIENLNSFSQDFSGFVGGQKAQVDLNEFKNRLETIAKTNLEAGFLRMSTTVEPLDADNAVWAVTIYWDSEKDEAKGINYACDGTQASTSCVQVLNRVM